MASPSALSTTPIQGPSSDQTSWAVLAGVDCTAGGSCKKAILVLGSDAVAGGQTYSVDAGSSSGWSIPSGGQAIESTNNSCGIVVLTKDNPTNNETLNVACSSAQQFSAILILTDATGGIAVASAFGSTNTVCNPPSVDTGAVRDFLAIACRSSNTGNSLATAAPSGYTGLVGQAGATTGNGGGNCQVAFKAITGAQTEDPGAFTGGANIWVSLTVGVWMAAGDSSATGLATETDTALALARKEIRAVGLATEADSSVALSAKEIGVAARADEIDTALALQSPGGSNVGLAIEAETALALHGVEIAAVARAAEASAASPLVALERAAIARAAENDNAVGRAAVEIGVVGSGDESDQAITLASGSGLAALVPPARIGRVERGSPSGSLARGERVGIVTRSGRSA